MCLIAAAIRPAGSALRRAKGAASGSGSADVRGGGVSVVRSCVGVRCSFGVIRRWGADADGMRVALGAHDEVLRKAIEAHGRLVIQAHR
jgi:hypothetical protein